MRDCRALMGPALVATAGVVLFVFAAAAASPTGMQLGGYVPFAWRDFVAALNDLTGWTVGLDTAVRDLARARCCSAAWRCGLRPAPAEMARRPGAALRDPDPRRPAWRGLGPVGEQRLCALLSGERDRPAAARVGVDRPRARQAARVRAAAAALLGVARVHRPVARFELIELQRGRPDGAGRADGRAIARRGARVALDPSGSKAR